METPHGDQTANSAKGTPARQGVTSSDSSLGVQSEKTLVEHAEETITSPPSSAPPRGFWRRILDCLSGSIHSRSSKGSPPLPDQPEKTHRSPTPMPQTGRWVKPTTTCTVERGYIASRHYYKYGFTRHYSPVERVTSRTIASAPWLIQVSLYSNTVAGLVDALSRSPEALHLCWYDKISVMNRSIAKKKKSYARVIRLGYVSPDGSRDWATCFIIWHDDPQWLDGLSYSDMRGMLLRRLLIRTSGRKYDTDDRLKNSELFYLRLQKPGSYPGVEGDGVPSAESLRATLDIQEPILWEQFDNLYPDSTSCVVNGMSSSTGEIYCPVCILVVQIERNFGGSSRTADRMTASSN